MTIGGNNDVSYDSFYSQCFKIELSKVKELQNERGQAEVELFILSKEPFNDGLKDIWTDDMMNYYIRRCDEIKTVGVDGHGNDMGRTSGQDEVGSGLNATSEFLAQDDVSNVHDVSMA